MKKHGEKAVLEIVNNILKFKAEVPEILYCFRFRFNQDWGLDYIPYVKWGWWGPFDVGISVSYDGPEVAPFKFEEPVKFDLELNVNININEVMKKMTSDFQELKLSDDLESDLRSAIRRWWDLNHRKYLKTKRFDGTVVRISSLISLEGYNQIKKDLLAEAGVSDVDTPDLVYSKIIRHISMADMWKNNESLLLDNNDMVVNMFGKCMPNIVFVLKNEYNSYRYEFGRMPNDIKKDLNIHWDGWDGSPSIMYGKFWISKKGSKCFTPTSRELATHMLIENTWGGAFDHTRGREYENVSSISEYARRTSSNGGGCGFCYYIMKKETKNVITIDDI